MNTRQLAMSEEPAAPPHQLHVRLVQGVTHHFPARGTEWMTAMVMWSIGWTLLAPGSTFSASPAWASMASMASEETWGAICFAIGTLRIVALLINGTFDRFTWSPHIRAATSFAACFIWYHLATGLSAAGINSTGAGTYSVIGAFELWNIYWAASNAKMADVARRLRRRGHRLGADDGESGDAGY